MNRLTALGIGLAALLAPMVAVAADIPAVVSWSQRVELGTLVSGVVQQVHVDAGQKVSKGDILVSLDRRGFATQVSRRTAEHRHAQARLAEARREDERAIELYDRTVLSDFERNQALIALRAAQATAEQARAALVEARLDLERSEIRAPFDGVVLAVDVAPGQAIVSDLQSRPLVTVADTTSLRARALIDAAQAGQLEVGQTLRTTLRGQELQARVGFIGFEPASQSGQGLRYELFAELVAGAEQKLRVGETVVLHLD